MPRFLRPALVLFMIVVEVSTFLFPALAFSTNSMVWIGVYTTMLTAMLWCELAAACYYYYRLIHNIRYHHQADGAVTSKNHTSARVDTTASTIARIRTVLMLNAAVAVIA